MHVPRLVCAACPSTHLALPLQRVPPPLLLQLQPLCLGSLLLQLSLLLLSLQPPLRSMPGSQALRLCPAMLCGSCLLGFRSARSGASRMPPLSFGRRSCLLLGPQRLPARLCSRLLLILQQESGGAYIWWAC